MDRRTFLAGGGAAIMAVAGCLTTVTDDTASDESTPAYDSCGLSIVSYERLPPDIRHEVDVAFADGRYRNETRVLWAQIDDGIEALYDAPGHASDDYFEPIVEEFDEMTHLRFEETTVTDQFAVRVVNSTDEPIAGSITIERDPVVVNESFDIPDEASKTITIGEVSLGEYDVGVSYEGGAEATTSVENNYYETPLGPPQVLVEPDGVTVVGPPDDGGRREPCAWDSDGTVTSRHDRYLYASNSLPKARK